MYAYSLMLRKEHSEEAAIGTCRLCCVLRDGTSLSVCPEPWARVTAHIENSTEAKSQQTDFPAPFLKSNIWLFRQSNIWLFRQSNIWLFRQSNFWVFRQSNIWLFRKTNIWLLRYVWKFAMVKKIFKKKSSEKYDFICMYVHIYICAHTDEHLILS
jgi:hypothetical protein